MAVEACSKKRVMKNINRRIMIPREDDSSTHTQKLGNSSLSGTAMCWYVREYDPLSVIAWKIVHLFPGLLVDNNTRPVSHTWFGTLLFSFQSLVVVTVKQRPPCVLRQRGPLLFCAVVPKWGREWHFINQTLGRRPSCSSRSPWMSEQRKGYDYDEVGFQAWWLRPGIYVYRYSRYM